MPNNENLAFAEAVRLTLAYCGAEVFEDPQRFVTYLYDMTDNRSDEMRVLRNNCTAELLAPFKAADWMTSVDLKRAAAEAQEYLTEECQINVETSRSIARGIAEGVARWRGLTIDWGNADSGNGGTQDTTSQETPIPKRRWYPLAVGAVALVFVGWVIVAMLPGFTDAFSRLLSSRGATDEEGGIWVRTATVTTSANGDVTDSNSRTYDDYGNDLSFSYESVGEEGRVYTGLYTYGEYDSNGYPAWAHSLYTSSDADGKITYKDQGGTNYVYEIDERGRLKKRTATGERASWFESSNWDDPWFENETTTYAYEGNNLVKKESENTSVNGDNKYVNTHVTEYDSYGNMTHDSSRSSHDGEVYGMWDTSTTYELDNEGVPRSYKRISTDTYDDESTVTVTTAECDEHGFAVKEITTEDGTTTTTTYENKYDDHGNLVSRKNLTDGSETTFDYLYIEHPSFAARHEGWQ